jgi:hypothetical protein
MKLTCKACILTLLLPGLLHGQEVGLLRMDPDHRVSETRAALWGGVEEGGFKPTWAASFQWSAGADAKVLRHGKTTSWTGALSFEQMMGQHMYSSMFLEPEYYPLDVQESVQGVKSRQTARLEAGFLSELGYEWAAGLKASVKGGHIAKKQDVRHSSFAVDAQVAPVVTYIMDDDMGLVSSYFVRYRMESLKAEEGAGDLFLDKGMRYGEYQALEGNGVFPVRELSHGFSGLLSSPEVSVGLDMTWKRGQGGGPDGGRFKFPGSTVSAFIQHSILADVVDHTYRISYKRERDQLREAADIGWTSVSDRRDRELGLKYEARFVNGAVKSVAVAVDGNEWQERFLVSRPTIDETLRYDATATLSARLSFGDVDLDLNALAGRGWWKDPGLAVQWDIEPYPVRQTEEWFRRMEYLMKPRVGVGGTLTVRIPGVKGLFVQAEGSWCRAFQVTHLGGKNRETGLLRIGYDF